jgi:hypothetical protein
LQMDRSKKRSAFSLRSRVVQSLSRLGKSFFCLPTVSSLEGFFLRLFFGIVVAHTISLEVPFHDQPHPVGLAHFFDLTWLSDPVKLSTYRSVIYLLLIVYAAGWLLPIVLPGMAVGYTLMFTLYNSQGYIHHGYQIISLTLVAQAAAVLYYTALKGLRLRPPDPLLNAWLLVQSQVVVTGTYLVSFLTKVFSTGGMWFWNANYIAIDLIKTQRQHYFSRFNPVDAGDPAEALWLLEHPWIARGLFTSGAILEAVAFFALASRKLGFLLGVALILMHRSVSMLMGLRFQNNELLCVIFLVGVPYIVARCLERVRPEAIRLGLLVGAGLGVPLSYFAQPVAVQSSMPFPLYLIALVNSISVWANGNWMDILRFTLPMWTTCVVTAAVGTVAAYLISEAKRRTSVL